MNEITDEDIHRFTTGGCVTLAIGVYQETGWPVCSFYQALFGEYILHAFARTPRGTYLDISGEHSAGELHQRWDDFNQYQILEVPPGDFERVWGSGYGRGDYGERADEIVPVLVRKYHDR